MKVVDLLKERVNTLEGHGGLVWSVAWDPEGRHLASGASDGRIFVWDISTTLDTGSVEK